MSTELEINVGRVLTEQKNLVRQAREMQENLAEFARTLHDIRDEIRSIRRSIASLHELMP